MKDTALKIINDLKTELNLNIIIKKIKTLKTIIIWHLNMKLIDYMT